jgi:hypothetical protein
MTMAAKFKRLQNASSGILASTWLGCFCVCLIVPCIMRLQSSIESDTLQATLGSISDAYSANLAVILGFYFHSRLKLGHDSGRSIASLLVALVATVIWNLFTVGAYLAAFLNAMAIDEATKLVGSVAPRLSWLVAPMLGYYFATPKEQSQT